jgi:hypothetical protein
VHGLPPGSALSLYKLNFLYFKIISERSMWCVYVSKVQDLKFMFSFLALLFSYELTIYIYSNPAFNDGTSL